MNFANLSPLAVVGGIVALAGILYALQKLRIRFQEVNVATVIFWKEALTEAPVRTFRQRFSHFWAYLLILAICSVVWLAIAEPEWENDGNSDFYVLLLDGSAGMARVDRFEAVVADLKADLENLAPAQRQVIWCGATTTTLLNAGEHHLLLDKRLAQLKPEAAPASIAHQLRQLAATRRAQSATKVRIYGDAPVSEQALAALPDNFDVKLASRSAEIVAGNSGITALGVAEAASGEWGKVDLLFRIEGDDVYLPSLTGLSVMVNGQPLAADKIKVDANDSTYWVENIDADGQLFTVEITEADRLPLDNRASIRLPKQKKIRVQLSSALGAELAAVLRADKAVDLVDDNPDVVIRAKGELLGGNQPALEFITAEKQSQAFLFGFPDTDGVQSQAVDATFSHAVQQIGLGNIDATGLADAAQKPIEVSMQADDQWSFSVWAELLSSDYNFVQSRSFPLFVAHSVRWLAGVERWYPYAPAGRPLPAATQGNEPSFVSSNGKLIETLGADFIPAEAGEVRRAGNEASLAVALLDGNTTRGGNISALESDSFTAFPLNSKQNSLMWLLLLALGLIIGEWLLYQKGRMP